MFRFTIFAMLFVTVLLLGCAGPEPVPESGMEVIQHARGEEMQVATGVDWNSYTKIILHTAPVAFTENWRKNQERLHGREMRDVDVQRIEDAVSGQLSRAMHRAMVERGGYELTSEPGPGVMVFMPNIVDLDITATGWVESSILESLPDTRGAMTTEVVIRDSVSDELLAVAWQQQRDPRRGDLERTVNVNNSQAIRLMSQHWADWLLKQLEEAKAGASGQ